MAWIPQTTTLADCVQLLSEQSNLAAVTEEVGELSIAHLSYDSRNIAQNTLFICKGAHFKPEYLEAAVRAGAIAYVSETDHTMFLKRAGLESVPGLLVHEIRPALADIAAFYYRGLLDHLTLIGLTGTKGKSSTTYMLRSILDSWLQAQNKAKSAWLSSIENYDGATLEKSVLTTQDVLELYAHFKNAVDNNITYLTMEVSSQALKYDRTRNLWFEVAGFLNIGEDHISPVEHPDHEDYLNSKLAIFKQSHSAVVNENSNELSRILKAAKSSERCLTFGFTEHADVVACDVQAHASGLNFVVKTAEWEKSFALPMAGLFNVENALAALSVALILGVPVEHMQHGLAHCEVSGRMQLIAGPDDKLVIIDYAHNKMSFETIFSTVSREYTGRPIYCVFGATGSKGSERRIDLPAVAVRYADRVYITEDDPGEEPLAVINQQIAEVIKAAGGAYTIIEDRDRAIECAINDSPAGSVVLILGKGHETVMKRGRDLIPVLPDAERVRRVLE